MTPLFAALETTEYLFIIIFILLIVGRTAFAAKQQVDVRRLERKLDLLLKHHGIALPSPLSPEVQRLAQDPASKIAAIKLHREQNPGLGLAEAKAEVEEFGQKPGNRAH